MVIDKITELNASHPTLTEDDAIAAIMITVAEISNTKNTCMPESVSIEKPQPATGVKLVLQGVIAGQLKNGWQVYATYNGCPETPVQRFAVLDFSDGLRRAIQINPGRSLANMSVMRDTSASAAMSAYIAAKKTDASCDGKDMDLVGSRIVSQSDDLGPDVFGVRYTGSWKEIWTFKTCGQNYDVPITFRADGDGGAYTHVSGDGTKAVGK
ncbi:MAG: hypothetical protein AAGE37_09520 [Pseudomonadota bacterium]